jgi:hypothetical protein
VSIIEKYFINNNKIDDVSLPCALCLTYQKVLSEYGRGIFNRKIELLVYSRKNTFPRPRPVTLKIVNAIFARLVDQMQFVETFPNVKR